MGVGSRVGVTTGAVGMGTVAVGGATGSAGGEQDINKSAANNRKQLCIRIIIALKAL